MHCLLCHQPVTTTITWGTLLTPTPQEHPKLCQPCNQKLEPITGEQCHICSRPFAKLDSKYRTEQDLCSDCHNWEQDPKWNGLLTKNISVLYYNNFLKDLLARYKFRGDHELAKIFAASLQQMFKQTIQFNPKEPPLIIPVPLSPERLYERGFNQAQSLANLLNLPTEEILTRTHTEKQSKKKRSERLSQQPPFHLKPNLPTERYQNKRVLLIDDIYTTGTTLRQIARTLKPLSPKSITSLTLARS